MLNPSFFILTGTSSSGKSTIAKELEKKSANIVHIDVDVITREEHLRLIKEDHPNIFKKLFKIIGKDISYYSICSASNDIFFLKNIAGNKFAAQLFQEFHEILAADKTFEEKMRYHIGQKIQRKIEETINSGKIALLDIVIDREGIDEFKRLSPQIITLYHPLQKLNELLYIRNRKAVLENSPLNFRNPEMVYGQLGMLFMGKEISFFSSVLEKICYNDLVKIITKGLQDHKKLRFKASTNPKDIVKETAKNLGLINNREINIGIKNPCDLLLNARDMEINEIVNIIYNYINNKILP